MASSGLDDILQSALEEIEDEGEEEEAPRGPSATAAAAQAAAEASKTAEQEANASTAEVEAMTQGIDKFMEQLGDPSFVSKLDDAFKQLSEEGKEGELPDFLRPFAAAARGESGAGSASAAAADGESSTGGTGASEGAPALDAGVAETLRLLSQASQGFEGVDPAAAEQMGEDVMRKMMEDFEKMSEKEDFGEVMDGIMRQLVSRDIMYEPIQKICEKFPEWLAENESTMDKAEFERYGKQYQFFQQILAVYDTEPDNIARITELMQDVQETGAPPADIIKDLAPGLEYGPNGLPVMPGMGGMPGMPGMPGGPAGAGAPGIPSCPVQ
mmetsp:Transcript_8070/g.25328  ORF Transcript_8070/g.25328 Transcript_8070/m.25328 type:complete len:327 (-) Transcript_8070:54-1034(-)